MRKRNSKSKCKNIQDQLGIKKYLTLEKKAIKGKYNTKDLIEKQIREYKSFGKTFNSIANSQNNIFVCKDFARYRGLQNIKGSWKGLNVVILFEE